MKKRLAAILAILVLLTAFGFSLHQHGDGLSHDDCPTCIASSHHHSTTSDAKIEILRAVIGFNLPVCFSQFFHSDTIAAFIGRAPPLFS